MTSRITIDRNRKYSEGGLVGLGFCGLRILNCGSGAPGSVDHTVILSAQRSGGLLDTFFSLAAKVQ